MVLGPGGIDDIEVVDVEMDDMLHKRESEVVVNGHKVAEVAHRAATPVFGEVGNEANVFSEQPDFWRVESDVDPPVALRVPNKRIRHGHGQLSVSFTIMAQLTLHVLATTNVCMLTLDAMLSESRWSISMESYPCLVAIWDWV